MRRKFISSKNKISSLLLALLLLGFTGCGVSSSADDNVPPSAPESEKTSNTTADNEAVQVKIADFKIYPATSQIIIAEKKGFFDEEFSKVNAQYTVEKFLNGPAINEAYAAGSVDLSPIGELPTVTGIANTRGQKIIATNIHDLGVNILVRKDGDINSAADLKGKSVGYGVGTSNQIVLQRVLEAEGLSIDDVNSINIPEPAELRPALINGSVDAVITGQPQVTTFLREEDNIKSIYTTDDDPQLVTFVGRTEFIEENPEATKAFLRAIKDTNEWIAENREEAVDIIIEETGSSKESVEAIFDNLENVLEISDKDKERLQYTAQYLKDSGSIDDDFKIDEFIDTSYVDEVLKK